MVCAVENATLEGRASARLRRLRITKAGENEVIDENDINRLTERMIGAAIEVHGTWARAARIGLSGLPAV